jgi:hypothetical protein
VKQSSAIGLTPPTNTNKLSPLFEIRQIDINRPQVVHSFLCLSITSHIRCHWNVTCICPKMNCVPIANPVLLWLDCLSVVCLQIQLQFPCPPTDISKPQLARSFLYVSLTLRISYIVRGRIHIAVPKMLHSCKFTQRVYGSTASFRLQIPLRGSHIPRDRTLNTTVVITPSQTALENNDPT